MGHIRIRDDLSLHPWCIAAGPEAMAFWLLAACWSSAGELAGVVPDYALRAIPHYRPALADKLVAAGLWLRSEDGYRFVTRDYRNLEIIAFGSREEWDKSAYEQVYARDGQTCRYCGATQRLTIDHIVPRVQGGHDGPSNLVVACRSCNSRKGGRTPEQASMALRPAPGAA